MHETHMLYCRCKIRSTGRILACKKTITVKADDALTLSREGSKIRIHEPDPLPQEKTKEAYILNGSVKGLEGSVEGLVLGSNLEICESSFNALLRLIDLVIERTMGF